MKLLFETDFRSVVVGSPPLPDQCPHSGSWQHADIAECLDMPVGTLLIDEQGHYCPACGFRRSHNPWS